MLLKKVSNLLLILAIILSCCPYVFAQHALITNFLFELGQKYYLQGRYDLALKEFQKALLLNPNLEIAREFIQKIKKEMPKPPPLALPTPPAPALPPALPPAPPVVVPPPKKEVILPREEVIRRALEEFEVRPQILPPEVKIPLPPKVLERLILDEKVLFTQPETRLEIELNKSTIISGKEILRWLVTTEEIISIERDSPDEIRITGENIGMTYLHIWDNRGRWTFRVYSVPPKPVGPTLEEELRLAEEKGATFKLRYSSDGYLHERGRRWETLERISCSHSHRLRLDGPTPYGDLDSALEVRGLRASTDLTYFTLGLTEGRFGRFRDFSLRGFDYSPGFFNLSFGGAALRGVMLRSPAFDRKVDYCVFWGREGGGRYGGLSPGLAEVRDSFLSGLDLDYRPSERVNYGFSVIRGWGRDRPAYLNEYSYNLDIDYRLNNWDFGYEIAFDSETFGHLLSTVYSRPRLRLTTELRNIDKDFLSITGYGWRRGEIGGLFTLSFIPIKDLHISNRLDIFRDRLFPSPEEDDRYNIDYNFDTIYVVDPLTSLRFDYSLQNQLGRIFPYRSHSQGIGLFRTFDWIRRINTYLIYRHTESKHFGAPLRDFIRDKVSLGMRFNLIADLYYYLNKEFNWLEERYTGIHTRPEALETGISWYGKIPKSPFYGNFRLLYRDEEEDAAAAVVLLTGEDYLEGYGEISYRPRPETEGYISARIRNVWPDNPNLSGRIEVDFRAGIRYLWDTGIRWEQIGSIEGYVFNDLNSDGLMQKDEPPLEGIRLWLGKDRFQITDKSGYYKFKRVRARKAYVNLDASTLPSGFVLTVPVTQEASITHGHTLRLDFGVMARSEISGFVFEDIDGDGKYGLKDKGVSGVIITLEDGTKAITDDRGRYSFLRVLAGERTIILDLNSLPIHYLPQVPLTKKITLFEGVTYNYLIPLKRIKE